jgi:hypothetical protein
MVRKPMLSLLREKMNNANRRLLIAMACYGILALISLIVLLPVRSSNDAFLLGLVLFIFAFLAIRTLAHSQDE